MTKGEFHIGRRVDLYLKICQDPTLDRTAIHAAAVLLLKHTNRETAKTVPGRDTIAAGMGRGLSAVSDGLRSLKVRWLRQQRRLGTSASYEWNWAGVSAEEWQNHSTNVRTSPQHKYADKPTDSNVCTSPHIHIEEPKRFNQEGEPKVQPRSNEESPTIVGQRKDSSPVDYSRPVDHSRPSDRPTTVDQPKVSHSSPTPTTGDQPQAPSQPTAAPASGTHAAFARIRQVYPPSAHGNDWETGLTAFARLVENGADPEFILAQVGKYAAVRNRANEPKYTKTITNWLESGGWKLEYPDPSPLLSNHPHAAAARFGFEYWKRKGGLH
jgi:hypothetical protein